MHRFYCINIVCFVDFRYMYLTLHRCRLCELLWQDFGNHCDCRDRQVSCVCDWHYRCGSRTEGPSGVRRRRRGASRASWLSTGCTAPWYGTRYHFQTASLSQLTTVLKSHWLRGFSVSFTSWIHCDLMLTRCLLNTFCCPVICQPVHTPLYIFLRWQL